MKSFFLFLSIVFLSLVSSAQDLKKEQLIEPSELAKKLSDPESLKPVVFNVGPVDQIKSAINIGAVNTEAGMKKLRLEVAKIPKNKAVVVYCGCCTSANCPNIRLAINYLVSAGYTKAKVLNIPTGIKEDWVQKNYPMED
ncbi:MAG: rhodanese-like domain-containing protein [Bacteroidota bacterium]|nr:rhodanese-like domain-containing protein [Bacteroidota bacterium]